MPTIRCPFPLGRDHDTSDNCGEPMTIKLSKRVRGGMYAPEEPPDIIEVDGKCPHVAAFNHGDLDDARIWAELEDLPEEGGQG